MIHQPSGGAKGQATEIKIVAENILKTRKKLNEILAANTGKPLEVMSAIQSATIICPHWRPRNTALLMKSSHIISAGTQRLRHQAGNVKQQVKDMKG